MHSKFYIFKIIIQDYFIDFGVGYNYNYTVKQYRGPGKDINKFSGG